MNDLHPHFLVAQLAQRSGDSLGAALDVRLDDNIEILDLALFDVAEQIFQRDLLL